MPETEQTARAFIDALHTLEDTKDAGPLAALYAGDAKSGNVLVPDRFDGPDGARAFWTEYRGSFETAHSEFRNVIAGDGAAALEWTTEGTGVSGSPFRYSGVTILEIKDGRVTRSSAYFDPKALGRQIQPE